MGELSRVPGFDDYLLAHSILTDARTGIDFSTMAIANGATGLGLALVELSSEVGVLTIVGVQGPIEEADVRARGANHVIRRDTTEFVPEVMRITGEKGAELIVDQIAGENFASNFDMLADFGDILVTGWSAGDPAQLFETMWAKLDRCPCMQLWTLDRYRSDPDRLARLEHDVKALGKSTPRSEVGA